MKKLTTSLFELFASFAVLAVLAAFIGLCALGTLRGLQWTADQAGYVFLPTAWQFAAGWYAVGALCALYWPIRFRAGMRGHWGSALKGLPLLALTGPFALVLGYPV